MKVGILTLPLHTNYGGILQAYALQTTLERMGHEVVVFQTYYYGIQVIPFYRYPLIMVKRLLYKCLVNHKAIVFWERKMRLEAPTLRANTEPFIKRYLHTCNINSLRDISPQNYDAIIVGSDQIWRPKYVRRMWKTDIQDAFLRFTAGWNIRRIGYAVSFGVDTWDYTLEETHQCKQLIQKFNAVSVRELSGVNLCAKNLEIKAEQVLDPTLLLTDVDYKKLIGLDNNCVNSNILFSYILDETAEIKSFVNKVARERELIVSSISINKNLSLPVEERVIPPIENWLRCFYNAKFVVTDSFHGCVFSIIFRKPFIVIGNFSRGLSRFESLLKILNVESSLLLSTDDYSSDTKYQLPNDIDERIENLQKESRGFLYRSLTKFDTL